MEERETQKIERVCKRQRNKGSRERKKKKERDTLKLA